MKIDVDEVQARVAERSRRAAAEFVVRHGDRAAEVSGVLLRRALDAFCSNQNAKRRLAASHAKE